MKNARNSGIFISCTVMMIVLILDSRTAAAAVAEGISLCLKTVIPALFPMMVLSDIVTSRLNGRTIPGLKHLRISCGIPSGAEGIFLAGLVGGYPIGARCVSQAYGKGELSRQDAENMLRFCSNAGPAFIFGICGTLFSSGHAPWLLWLIHIISAVLVGIVCQSNRSDMYLQKKTSPSDITSAVWNGVKTMGIVCGWIVIFRVIIRFLQLWLLWLFPAAVSVILSGILELTNGCCMLSQIRNEQLRFILCSILLAFGGLCIAMQTASVSKDLSVTKYAKGKILQTLFSFLLSLPGGAVLFSAKSSNLAIFIYISALCLSPFILQYFKKTIAFQQQMIYNTAKQ